MFKGREGKSSGGPKRPAGEDQAGPNDYQKQAKVDALLNKAGKQPSDKAFTIGKSTNQVKQATSSVKAAIDSPAPSNTSLSQTLGGMTSTMQKMHDDPGVANANVSKAIVAATNWSH